MYVIGVSDTGWKWPNQICIVVSFALYAESPLESHHGQPSSVSVLARLPDVQTAQASRRWPCRQGSRAGASPPRIRSPLFTA